MFAASSTNPLARYFAIRRNGCVDIAALTPADDLELALTACAPGDLAAYAVQQDGIIDAVNAGDLATAQALCNAPDARRIAARGNRVVQAVESLNLWIEDADDFDAVIELIERRTGTDLGILPNLGTL